MSPPPPLLDLPAELQLHVLGFLSTHDVATMSRLSKALRSVALSELYRSVFLNLSREDEEHLFFRTISAHPQYLDCLRILRIRGKPWPDTCVNETVFDIFLKFKSIENFYTDLCFLLELYGRYDYHASFERVVSQFDRLTHLVIDDAYSNFAEERNVIAFPHTLLPFFLRVPTLRHLTTSDICGIPSHGLRSSSLRALTLNHTRLPTRDLARLLSYLANLEELTYDFAMYRGQLPLELGSVREAIIQLQSSLKCLEIRIGLHDKTERISPLNLQHMVQHSLGPLTGFSALTKLNTSLAVLYGATPLENGPPLATYLPRSLRSLIINDDCWDCFDCLHGVTTQTESDPGVMQVLKPFLDNGWRSAMPQLESVTLVAYTSECSASMEAYWWEGNVEEYFAKV